jgi:hypothetical protein
MLVRGAAAACTLARDGADEERVVLLVGKHVAHEVLLEVVQRLDCVRDEPVALVLLRLLDLRSRWRRGGRAKGEAGR